MMRLLARMIRGDQVLAAVLDPFHRAAETKRCETHQYILRIHLAADAEAAADMAFEQIGVFGGAAKHFRKLVAIPVRHLSQRRTFPACRSRRCSGRWRRASPGERRNDGRSRAKG
jgi:hypothetical protein